MAATSDWHCRNVRSLPFPFVANRQHCRLPSQYSAENRKICQLTLSQECHLGHVNIISMRKYCWRSPSSLIIHDCHLSFPPSDCYRRPLTVIIINRSMIHITASWLWFSYFVAFNTAIIAILAIAAIIAIAANIQIAHKIRLLLRFTLDSFSPTTFHHWTSDCGVPPSKPKHFPGEQFSHNWILLMKFNECVMQPEGVAAVWRVIALFEWVILSCSSSPN